MILRKLTLALSTVALSFSVSAFAQQAAPQPEQQAPTNPAGEVIGKLATMGHMQFGDFPVTQTEVDRASEFVQARAAQTGKTITREQSLRLFLLLRQLRRLHLSPHLCRFPKQLRPLLSLPLKPTTSFLREQFRHSRSKSFLTA